MARPPFAKSLRQFQVEFATEETCQKYLAACRWPDGFLCPQCGHRQAYILEQKLRWQCAACRHQVSLTSGTVLHNTKTPARSGLVCMEAAYLEAWGPTTGLMSLISRVYFRRRCGTGSRQDHLACRIYDTLDQLDLSALHKPYEGDGRRNQPYHPTMLVKVLVYAYATGLFSSRRIASKLIDDVALRLDWRPASSPTLRTINRFRQQHLENVWQAVRRALVQLVQKLGLVKLREGGAPTARKSKPTPPLFKAMSFQRMKEDDRQVSCPERCSTVARESASTQTPSEDELYRPRQKRRRAAARAAQTRAVGSKRSGKPSRRWKTELAEKDKQQGRHPGAGKVASET